MPSGEPICRLRASARRTSGNDSGGSPSGWVSPTAQDGARGSLPPRPHDTGIPLSQQVALTGWPTPTSLSPATADYNEAGDSCNLRKTRLLLTGWATPRHTDGSKNVRTPEGAAREAHRKGGNNDLGNDSELIPCADGRARRIPQSGIFPLADGVPGRVGRLRAYGNAICPQVAAVFIRAYRDVRHHT